LKDWGYYTHLRPEILALIPDTALRILDVGCGAGILGRELKRLRPDREVAGIELIPEVADKAKNVLDKVYVGDVESLAKDLPQEYYDCLILADIIEHLRCPKETLVALSYCLKDGANIICSVPNVAHWSVIRDLINGEWRYCDAGILDDTHLRFFTKKSIVELLNSVGWNIIKITAVRNFDGGAIPPAIVSSLNAFGLNGHRLSSEGHDYQFLIIATNSSRVSATGENAPDPKSLSSAERMLASATKLESKICEVGTSENNLQSSGPRDLAAASMKPADVTIIVPVHNKVEYTSNCLESVFQNTEGYPYEIVVVDNASSDSTPDFLAGLADYVRSIRNSTNIGFGEACNQAASTSSAKYLVFLNNDTEVTAGWLTRLVETAEADPSIGAVGSMLLYPDGRLQEAGGIIFSDGSGWNYGRGDDPQKPEYNYVREVDYCSGACLLVRSSVFQLAGGFDPIYSPAYYEDTDLCFRIRELGYKVVYQPFSRVIHCEGVTAGNDVSAGVKSYQVVNRMKFKERWRHLLCKQPPSPLAVISRAAHRSHGENILVIDPFMPLYDRASGSQRLFNILRLMQQSGYHITYIGRDGRGQDRYANELRSMGILTYSTDPERMAELGYKIQAPRVDLETILSLRNYSVAWLSFYELAGQYLPLMRRFSPYTAVIVDSVDVHFLRERREGELKGNARLIANAEQTRLRELGVYGQADLVITVTENDRQVLLSENPNLCVAVIPNIHESPSLNGNKGFEERSGILFVGNFAHRPNIDAVIYLCEEIFPMIHAEIQDIRLFVVGNNPPPEVRKFHSGNVIVTGYVPDLTSYLTAVRVSVAPLRYGAGMKGKIGEAMAAGVPVVTTSIGAEGMELVNGHNVLVADDPVEFARAVIRLYQDKLLWEKLSLNGQAIIRKLYSPDVTRLKLAQALDLAKQNASSRMAAGMRLQRM